MSETQVHIALPLKYRPKTFDDVVGQEHVTRTLRNAIASGRIANAYLFVGSRGIGKTTLSRIFAKAINCPTPNGVEPCDTCESCRQIAEGRSIDVVELDGASHNKVEDVRPIIEGVQFKPAASKYKIFIVDECHMLTPSAWNALLKTLEEPPPYVRFIFATTEGDKLLATIISRCQRFDLRRIRYICEKEGINASEDALLAIARGAEGGMRDALSSLDQLIAFTGDKITEEDALGVFGLVSRKSLEDLAGAILTGDAAAILRAVESFDSAGKDMRRLAGELMQHFRNLLVCQTLGGNAAGIEATPDQIKVLQEQAKLCPASRLFRVTDQLAEMQDKLRYVLSVRTLIEMTLLRAARVATVASIEEVLKAVRELAGRAGAAAPQAVPPASAGQRPATPIPSAGQSPATPKASAQPAPPPQSVPGGSRSRATAAPQAAAPKPATKPELSADERQKILDDDKLNDLLKALPGAKITDLR